MNGSAASTHAPHPRAMEALARYRNAAAVAASLRLTADAEPEPGRRSTVPDRVSRLRARYVYGPMDAALGAECNDPDPLSGRMSRFQRTRVRARLLQRRWPIVEAAARASVLRTARLPFGSANGADPRSVQVLGVGSTASVYQLAGTDGAAGAPLVLKVYRRTLGAPVDTLTRYACYLRARHEALQEWFAGCDLLLPTHYLLLHAPVRAAQAAAALQPRVFPEFDTADLLTDEATRDRLAADARLTAQLREVVVRAKALWDIDLGLDILGRENLIAVRTSRGLRLKLLDASLWLLPRRRARMPAAVATLERRLDDFRKLCADIADPRDRGASTRAGCRSPRRTGGPG